MTTEAALLEIELRLRVQRRINDGRLPVVLVRGVEASYGTGEVCCVCDQPITSDTVEYDIVGSGGTDYLSFHLFCHVIWQLECALRVGRTEPGDDVRISNARSLH